MRFRKFIICLLFTGVFLPAAYSQDMKVKISKAEFKTSQESGLDEAWNHIKSGDKLYKEGRGTYPEAREHYLSANSYNTENPELNYKIGVCYLFADRKYEAINYFRKAYVADNEVSTDIQFMLARSYHMVMEFDKAIQHYLEFKNSLSQKELNVLRATIDRHIDECNNGKILVAEPVRVIINNIGDKVNSTADDYYSIFGSGDSIMYLTSRRQHHEKAKRSELDNKFYEDIYYSVNKDGEWGEAVNIGKPISDMGSNTAAVGLSADGKNLFVYKGDKQGGNLYSSQVKKGSWSSPKSMSRFNSKQRETGMSLSKDGKTIYFISSDEKETYGGKDVFFSERTAVNKWGKPENIGRTINTTYDEEGVYISNDGQTLYFSSRGHNSMGGYDVFKSVKDDLGEWTSPVNLGYPINTPDDELFYSTDEGGKYAYYSADRLGSLGGKDIFQIFFLGSEKEMLMSTEDILIAGTIDEKKTGFFTVPGLLSIDTSFILIGKVYDIGSGEGVKAKLDFIDVDKSKVVATTITNDSGAYRAVLPEGKAYGVEIVATDYMLFLDMVDISRKASGEEIPVDFGLEKVEVGATVVLENIFFETGKATLKPESFPQLDQVVKFMESNRSISMEISGHTDNTGSLKTNTKLSQSRAEAVVDYLVEKGIDKSKLEAKGYAFSQPIAPNDTEEGRARNRRVEFKILGK